MSTYDKATVDNPQPSQPAAQQSPTMSGSGIKDKIGGVVNIIHGTGEVIRGHALEAGDFGHGHGNGKEIIAAGRDEVGRGLDRVEGKPAATSAAGDAPDWDRRGVGDSTGVAPDHDPSAPQASTAAPRADSTVEKGSGDTADAKYPVDSGTAGTATSGAAHGPAPEQRYDERTTATAPPDDPFSAADDPGVRPNTDVHQQGNGIASSDRDKGTGTTADASYPANVAGQEQPSGTASQA